MDTAPARAASLSGQDLAADAAGSASHWMEQVRRAHASDRHWEAAGYAERFASFGNAAEDGIDRAVLAELADWLFEAGERRRSGPIYALLHRSGPADPKIAVRYAEALIEAGDAAEALDVLRTTRERVTLDLWGRRALAQCESLAGNHDDAVALARAVLTERPDDPGFLATYLDVLVRTDDPDRWRRALEDVAGLPGDGARELRARLRFAEGSAEAAGLLLAAPLEPQSRLFFLALERAYAALSAGDVDEAAAISAHLLAHAAPDVATALLHANLLLHGQRWEAAAAWLEGLSPDRLGEPAMLVKRFEIACFTGELDQAARLLAELEATGPLAREATLPVLRYLAERQDWSALARMALAWLGFDFRYDQIGYVLFRAAQRTGQQARFVAAIEAIAEWRGSPDLVRLHEALAWDAATSLAAMDLVLAGSPASPAMQHRMRVERAIRANASREAGRRALFLCSDAAYLAGSIAALHSALEHSEPGREDVFLLVDDGLAARTRDVLQPFRTLGYPVTVLAASDVVGPAGTPDGAYGLFTSGHRLSAAAYYRIYLARALHGLGGYARAVYLDSDVLVLRSLDGLFTAELHGQPMAARVETSRPEVVRALAQHRLERYFNSGVLLFDLTNERLHEALDGTVTAITDDTVKLLLHDQCALNLGFRDRFAALPAAWNRPVGERDQPGALPAETAVLHFLDRPKPWSAAYDGSCAALWLDQWSRTAALIGAAAAVELLAMAGD